jgi:hypothetical protein
MSNKNPENIQLSKKVSSMSRRGLLKRSVLWGGLATLVSTFSLIPTTNNVEAAKKENWTITPLQGGQKDEYTRAFLASEEYRNFQELAQMQGAPALQGNTLSANLFSQGKTTFIYVSVSVKEGNEYSTYTAFFQPGTLTPTQTSGYLFIRVRGQNNLTITGVTNGKETLHITITPDGKVVQGVMVTADGKQVSLDGRDLSQNVQRYTDSSCCNWCCYANCLNSLGNIPNSVIYIAGLICSAACLNPATCVVCLLALGTITGFAITLCEGNCCFTG